MRCRKREKLHQRKKGKEGGDERNEERKRRERERKRMRKTIMRRKAYSAISIQKYII